MSNLVYELDMLKKPIWQFINAGKFAKDNLLYLQESGRFFSGAGYYTKRSGLDSFLITLTISGSGILEYCGEKYEMTVGSVMFINCQNPQFYYTNPKAGKWETLWVHFSGNNVKAYYQRFLEKSGGINVSNLSDSGNASEIIDKIINLSENYSKDAENEIIADNLLNSLLAECIIGINGNTTVFPDYVNKIASYIRHHYNEEINLDFLSREFNISKFHLQRTFKNFMGVSPTKYLSNVRIYRAKELLRGSNRPISEIAELVGMEQNYFIQLFKESENITPKQYRNKWCGKK